VISVRVIEDSAFARVSLHKEEIEAFDGITMHCGSSRLEGLYWIEKRWISSTERLKTRQYRVMKMEITNYKLQITHYNFFAVAKRNLLLKY
jgi:hypothetical protein